MRIFHDEMVDQFLRLLPCQEGPRWKSPRHEYQGTRRFFQRHCNAICDFTAAR